MYIVNNVSNIQSQSCVFCTLTVEVKGQKKCFIKIYFALN